MAAAADWGMPVAERAEKKAAVGKMQANGANPATAETMQEKAAMERWPTSYYRSSKG